MTAEPRLIRDAGLPGRAESAPDCAAAAGRWRRGPGLRGPGPGRRAALAECDGDRDQPEPSGSHCHGLTRPAWTVTESVALAVEGWGRAA